MIRRNCSKYLTVLPSANLPLILSFSLDAIVYYWLSKQNTVSDGSLVKRFILSDLNVMAPGFWAKLKQFGKNFAKGVKKAAQFIGGKVIPFTKKVAPMIVAAAGQPGIGMAISKGAGIAEEIWGKVKGGGKNEKTGSQSWLG
jgi:hypothetical protein